jgi:hypothetical protein
MAFHAIYSGVRPGISFRPDELLRKPSPRRQLQGSFIYIVQADNGMLKECHSKDAKFQTKYQLLRLKRKPEIPTSIPTIAAGTRSWMLWKMSWGSR